MNEGKNFETSLTPRQIRAIQALFSERTKKAAAEKAGISTVTLWRWSKQPQFLLAYKAMVEAQWEALGSCTPQFGEMIYHTMKNTSPFSTSRRQNTWSGGHMVDD